MKLSIKIDMKNDAFRENGEREVGRIMNEVTYTIAVRGISRAYRKPLFDTNGNKVGYMRVS